MSAAHYLGAFAGIARRELLRFVKQRERFLSALVRPLVWLVVFAAGFRAALGLSITAPYQTYIQYQVYIVPGLIGMIQLFNGMQSSLSMVQVEIHPSCREASGIARRRAVFDDWDASPESREFPRR